MFDGSFRAQDVFVLHGGTGDTATGTRTFDGAGKMSSLVTFASRTPITLSTPRLKSSIHVQISPMMTDGSAHGTTTSARMERFTRPLMEREGVRIIIGKGGMGQGTLDAFRDLGGAYLAIVGGAAALETTWIEAVEEVDMDDLHPESLWRFRIRNFGPLLVTMDSHGESLHREIYASSEAALSARL